jgi:hypothetical protein
MSLSLHDLSRGDLFNLLYYSKGGLTLSKLHTLTSEGYHYLCEDLLSMVREGMVDNSGVGYKLTEKGSAYWETFRFLKKIEGDSQGHLVWTGNGRGKAVISEADFGEYQHDL